MANTNQTRIGFTSALTERAEAHALWVLLSDAAQRDGYWLKPSPWEGPGEYQHVTFPDGRNVFVRVPDGRSLPVKRLAKAA